MDTKYFALQQWVEQDLLTLKRISTSDNEADAMTKNLARTLFYRHQDYIMGRVIPDYANKISSTNTVLSNTPSRALKSMGG